MSTEVNDGEGIPEEETKLSSIDEAIANCKNQSKYHRRSSIFWLSMLVVLLFSSAYSFLLIQSIDKRNINEVKEIVDRYEFTAPKLHTDIVQLNSKFYKTYSLRDELNDFAYNIYKPVTNSIESLLDSVYVFSDYSDTLYQSNFGTKQFISKSLVVNPKHKLIYFDSQLLESEISDAVSRSLLGDSTFIGLTQLAGTDFEKYLDKENNYISKNYIYLAYALFIFIIGIALSFYRYHLREAARNEHNLLGFQRIRIAGNNSQTGFDDYVKYYLSKDAFTFQAKQSKETVDSPVPGHPTSEAGAAMTNWLINNVKENIKSEGKDKQGH